jgi:hypothetical protein
MSAARSVSLAFASIVICIHAFSPARSFNKIPGNYCVMIADTYECSRDLVILMIGRRIK